jgi:integrase
MRQKIERDPKIPGLHIIHGKRRSTWYLYYRTKAKQERRHKLGPIDKLNVTRARELARKILVEVDEGRDPSICQAESVRRNARTLTDLRDEYNRLHAAIELKPSSRKSQVGQWNHILRILGAQTPVTDVTRAHIFQIKSELAAHTYQANRTLALIRHAFHLAEDWGWIEPGKTPVYRVKLYKETRRKRVPSIDEVRRLFDALSRMRQRNPWFAGMIALLCFVGARKNEIMTSRREWWQGDKLVLPDSKTGAKIVPINAAARSIFDLIPEVEGNPYLVVGRRQNDHLREPKSLWADLLRDAQIEDLRMHDLRRWFASVAISSGQTLEQTMQLMGHQSPLTTRGYAFLMDHARKQAAESTGDKMLELVTKKEPDRSRA